MRILVDYRPALRARTGVGEYMHELVRAYTAAHADDVAVFTSSWKDRPTSGLARELRAQVVDRRIPVHLLNLLWHRAGWPPIERLAGPLDVVHAAHPLLIPASRAAQIVTIHDLFFLEQPERTRAEIRRDYAPLAAAHARRADAIVTPSRYTAQRVAAAFGVPLDRIYPCTPGAPVWRTLGRAPNAPRDGYVLFLGTLEPRKNVGVLLDAYERLLQRHPGTPPLVLAGAATPDAAGWLERLERGALRGRADYRGYVADDQREALLAGARALVLPSLEEGFGFPVLEAMSAGVPVVASNRGSLPEVVGPAGTLVEPDDVEGLADAIERLITDDAWAANRAQAALDRARTFTWEESARRLRQAYLDAMERRRQR